MKRLGVALLFSLLIGGASAQLGGGLMFPGPGTPASSGGGGGCSQATAFLARNGGANSTATTALICGLVSDGIWSGFDAFWIMATDTAANGQLNAVSSSFPLTQVSSPTFTNKLGFTTSGGYLDTGFIPSSSGTNFTAHNGSLGFYIQSSGSGGVEMGALDTNTTQLATNFSSLTIYDINDSIVPTPASPGTTSGLWTVSRTASNAMSVYHGTSSTAYDTSTFADAAAPAFSMFIGGRNQSGLLNLACNRQFSIAFVGRGFTGAEHLAIANRVATYLAAL